MEIDGEKIDGRKVRLPKNVLEREIIEVLREQLCIEDDCKISDVIKELNDFLDEHGDGVVVQESCDCDSYGYNDYGCECSDSIFLVLARLETDKEYNKRINKLRRAKLGEIKRQKKVIEEQKKYEKKLAAELLDRYRDELIKEGKLPE